MFSQVSEILFTGGVCGGEAYVVGGMCGGGMHGRGHAWQGACACVAGGSMAGGRGGAWQGICVAGGHAWQGP